VNTVIQATHTYELDTSEVLSKLNIPFRDEDHVESVTWSSGYLYVTIKRGAEVTTRD
jgi:hypothetical protein